MVLAALFTEGYSQARLRRRRRSRQHCGVGHGDQKAGARERNPGRLTDDPNFIIDATLDQYDTVVLRT
jgi:hypothetical protein